MITKRRLAVASSTAAALVTLLTVAEAQPYGPGMMMGPGMMGRGSFGHMCSPAAAGFAEWRIARLEQLIKPTDAQKARFEELKAASTKAAEIMRSACPTEFPKTVVGRMDMMEKRADAMAQAIKTVRPVMEAFYSSLTDKQKAQLDAGSGGFWRWRDRP